MRQQRLELAIDGQERVDLLIPKILETLTVHEFPSSAEEERAGEALPGARTSGNRRTAPLQPVAIPRTWLCRMRPKHAVPQACTPVKSWPAPAPLVCTETFNNGIRRR